MSSLPGNAVPYPRLVPCPIAEVGDACVPLGAPQSCCRSRAARLQSLYLAFLRGGEHGVQPPGLGEERVPARHRGQPECTEELLRARAGSGPARPTAGAFGPDLHGDADFCPRGGRPLRPLSFGVSWWPSWWLGGGSPAGGEVGRRRWGMVLGERDGDAAWGWVFRGERASWGDPLLPGPTAPAAAACRR